MKPPANATFTTQPLGEAGFELLNPPHTLKRRALVPGTREAVLKLVIGATREIAMLTRHFDGWMRTESDRLIHMKERFRTTNDSGARNDFYRVVHDIRGNGPHFGYPLAGRIAKNLARGLDEIENMPLELVERHVEAIRAIVREKVKTDANPVGSMLAYELEKLVDRMIPAEVPDKQ